MRKRTPKHEAQLGEIQNLSPSDLIRRIGIRGHNDQNYLESEILATLIRNRFEQVSGVVDAAVVELNRRMQILVGKRMLGIRGQPEVARRGDQAVPDTIDYIWDHFYAETVPLSNSEARFAVYVHDRFDEFVRHLRAEKNSMESVDDMDVVDADGSSTPYIETVEDPRAETPEEALIWRMQSSKTLSTLMSLQKAERNAFYFRAKFEYEWQKIADLLGCSIPTARKHYYTAMERLKGALE
jgi:hypothetical protein